jgi:hypothetical protein
MAGSCWLLLSTISIEEIRAEQNTSKARISSDIPAKTSRHSPEAKQKNKPLPAAGETVRPLLPEVKSASLPKIKSVKTMSPESANAARKPQRVIKASKKTSRKAVIVQPRTDLMPYGVLVDTQRYDPRPHDQAAGVPNPQTPDLTYDHFQELDRNQDGKIDPVERAFSRIDMDRDLHTRTFK